MPQGTAGPANADASIGQNPTVSKDITLLDQHGSEVLLGNTLMVPIGQSIVYLRPLYVASSSTLSQPQLNYVIGVLGQKVVIESTVSSTLSDLLQTQISGGRRIVQYECGEARCPLRCSSTSTRHKPTIRMPWRRSRAGDLGAYQTDINAMQAEIANAQAALTAAPGTKTTPTTTTTTAPAKSKSVKTSVKTPTSTEPDTSTTATSLATASPPG